MNDIARKELVSIPATGKSRSTFATSGVFIRSIIKTDHFDVYRLSAQGWARSCPLYAPRPRLLDSDTAPAPLTRRLCKASGGLRVAATPWGKNASLHLCLKSCENFPPHLKNGGRPWIRALRLVPAHTESPLAERHVP